MFVSVRAVVVRGEQAACDRVGSSVEPRAASTIPRPMRARRWSRPRLFRSDHAGRNGLGWRHRLSLQHQPRSHRPCASARCSLLVDAARPHRHTVVGPAACRRYASDVGSHRAQPRRARHRAAPRPDLSPTGWYPDATAGRADHSDIHSSRSGNTQQPTAIRARALTARRPSWQLPHPQARSRREVAMRPWRAPSVTNLKHTRGDGASAPVGWNRKSVRTRIRITRQQPNERR